MTNVVDFTVPDPLSRERFAEQVAAYLRSHGSSVGTQQRDADRVLLQQTLRAWLNAAQTLDSQAVNEPRLATIGQRRKQWAELATSALDAIDLIESGRHASESWLRSREGLIKQSGEPKELVDFVILGPINQLFQAASTGSNPR
jgi:hypothetical protein